MVKVIWLSDTHYSSRGLVLGHDPRIRLDAAIDHINSYHGDADLCVISGDLVERGVEEEYQNLKGHLDNLTCRYFLMVGNHDARESLKSVFPMPQGCMSDFVQYAIPTHAGLVVCLDTQKSGHASGEICATRARWLTQLLDSESSTPTFLFMHHPPVTLGLPMQDTENLENGDEFLALIGRYRNVKHLFIGHVHRPVCGTVAGLPFATMRSALYQAPAPRPFWDWDSFEPCKEAPSLGVLTITDTGVNLQYTEFCGYETGT